MVIAEKATRAALYGIAVQHADDGYFGCGNFGDWLFHSMFLMYSPGVIKLFGSTSRGGEFKGIGWV